MKFLYSKIKKAYIEGGILLIIKRGWGALYRTNSAWWFVRDLSLPVNIYSSPFPLTVSNNQTKDVIEYMRKKDYLTNQELAVGEEAEHLFIGLIKQGEILGFCKCGFKRVYVNDFNESIRIPEHICFIYEYEIDESIRGRGIAKYFISSTLLLLKKQGVKLSVCHIPLWNKASIRVMELCGFHREGYVRFFNFAGVKIKTTNIDKIFEMFEKRIVN